MNFFSSKAIVSKIMRKSADYPVYRMYPNGRSFFKILSDKEFQQLEIIGSKYFLTVYSANNHFDSMYISDMLEMKGNHWLENTEREFEDTLERCKNELIQIIPA